MQVREAHMRCQRLTEGASNKFEEAKTSLAGEDSSCDDRVNNEW